MVEICSTRQVFFMLKIDYGYLLSFSGNVSLKYAKIGALDYLSSVLEGRS